MIEAVMYFVFGLLTAGLCALMIAPAIWRRAVRLTRMRIERSVPMTLAEIQADKDQLRAEFAMSTRRLEMTVDRLKEKAAEQLIEIDRHRDLIARLSTEQTGKVDIVRTLETRERELQDRLRSKEEGLANATADLSALEARLAERNLGLRKLEEQLDQANRGSDEKTVELVARGTEIDNLRDEISTTKAERAAIATERATFEARLAELRSEVIEERRRAEGLEARLQRVEAENGERMTVGARDEKELDALRSQVEDADKRKRDLEVKLADAESRMVEAEGRIAALALKLESDARDALGDSMQKTLNGHAEEKAALSARIVELEQARAALSSENSELRRLAGEDWEAERMENALLRERLNDVAAKVARLTKTHETLPEMLRPAAVAEPAAAPTLVSTNTAGLAAVATAPRPAKTLADRIRALQRPSSAG